MLVSHTTLSDKLKKKKIHICRTPLLPTLNYLSVLTTKNRLKEVNTMHAIEQGITLVTGPMFCIAGYR